MYDSKECETSFNHILVKEGLAKYYDGGNKN